MEIKVKLGEHPEVTMDAFTPLAKIATFICVDWKKMSPHAKPYVEAMLSLDNIEDNYIEDTGYSIVAYALSNMTQYKGENARQIKKLLNYMLKKG